MDYIDRNIKTIKYTNIPTLITVFTSKFILLLITFSSSTTHKDCGELAIRTQCNGYIGKHDEVTDDDRFDV